MYVTCLDHRCVKLNLKGFSLSWQRIFNKAKTLENRLNLCNEKKIYKCIVRKKKRAYKIKKSKEIVDLRTRKPKDFWQYFKKKSKQSSADISINDFRNYFENLFNDIKTTVIEDVENFDKTGDLNIENPTFIELNVPITHSEVLEAIKKLNRNKSLCPSDNLLN